MFFELKPKKKKKTLSVIIGSMACVLIASEHKRTLHLNVVYHNLLIFAFGNRLVKLENYKHNKVNVYLQGRRNDNISVLQKFNNFRLRINKEKN